MELKFCSKILQNENMDAAYVEVPYDIKELFGKGRLLVNATFDGIPYRGQVVKMGTPCYIIGVTKQIRKQIGKSFGDTVEVVLQERDSEKSPMWKCPKCGREFKKKGQSHYCGEKPKTIDEYILSQDEDKQEDLRYIRQILRSALPEAEERISWSIPLARRTCEGRYKIWLKLSIMVAELAQLEKHLLVIPLANLRKVKLAQP